MDLPEVGCVIVDWIQLAVDGAMTRICDTSVFRYKRGVNLTVGVTACQESAAWSELFLSVSQLADSLLPHVQ
jgi:hypothetical protein